MKKNSQLKQLLLISLIMLFSCGFTNSLPAKKKFAAAALGSFKKITILKGSTGNGSYDPSIEYDNKEVGWMVYSAVELPKYVHTDLATSPDHGKTWTFVKRIHQSHDGTISTVKKKLEGVWRYEVPALIYDPGDKGREWKLFWHTYFTEPPYKPKNRLFQFGWIAYSYAPTPAGPWAEEIPLFGAGPYPVGPFKTRINLSNLHKDLKNCVYYSEPGVLCKDGVIYMSMEGSTNIQGKGNWRTRKNFLIASRDHGTSWEYLGLLTDYDDAIKLGYVLLFSSSLVNAGGRQFLMLVPAGSLKSRNKGMDGLVVFEFEDIRKAKLKRDTRGNLIVHKRLRPSLEQGGPGDYNEKNTSGGFVMGQMNVNDRPEILQIFNVSEKITDETK